MEFANPKLLLLVWLTPLIAFWWVWVQRHREVALAVFMSRAMQSKLAPPHPKVRQWWQISLLVVGLFLCIIAMSRPQWGERQETVFHRGRDIVIALDVSRSMLANDVHPNRLTRAKTDLIDLIGELRGDRAALIAFRKDAQLICPLTTDYGFLRHALDGCGLHSAAAGETDIGSAIYKAMAAFDNEAAAHKAIVLISDGEDLLGKAFAAAEEAAKRGISIFTVGIGSGSGSRIPMPDDKQQFVTHQGKQVVTHLENETLDKIASITGGAYAPIATANTARHTLGDIYRQHLVKISQQDIEEKMQLRRVERYQWFLLPALLCFLVSAALSRGRLAHRARQRQEPIGTPSTVGPGAPQGRRRAGPATRGGADRCRAKRPGTNERPPPCRR